MFMDDIKIFAKNENKLDLIETITIYNQDIGMGFGIEKLAMLTMKNVGKEYMTRYKCLVNHL